MRCFYFTQNLRLGDSQIKEITEIIRVKFAVIGYAELKGSC